MRIKMEIRIIATWMCLQEDMFMINLWKVIAIND